MALTASHSAFWSRFRAGECPPRHVDSDLIELAQALGIDPTNGTMVNLGARLAIGHDAKSNTDITWSAFFSKRWEHLGLRVVGFEGDPTGVQKMQSAFNKSSVLDDGRRSRINMLYEWVDVHTVVRKLRNHNVPRDFFILKIDIDSFDFHAFQTIVHHFEPKLVFVEKTGNAWRGNPQRFTALQPPPEQVERPLYSMGTVRNVFDAKQHFACAGASPALWIEHAPRLGYEVLQSDGDMRNLILIPSRLRAAKAIVSSTNLSCFMQDLPSEYPRQQWTKTFRQINQACNVSRTPYFVEHEGVCCPTDIDGNETGLRGSRWCRCDLLHWHRKLGHTSKMS